MSVITRHMRVVLHNRNADDAYIYTLWRLLRSIKKGKCATLPLEHAVERPALLADIADPQPDGCDTAHQALLPQNTM